MNTKPLKLYRVVHKNEVLFEGRSVDNEQASRFHRQCPKGAALYRVETKEDGKEQLILLSRINQSCAELNSFMSSLIGSPAGSPDSD